MKDWWMRKMLLVNMMSEDGGDGDGGTVDFGQFFGSGGATKNKVEADGADDGDGADDAGDGEDYTGGDDESGDDDDGDGTDDFDVDDESEDDESVEADDNPDPTTISMSAIAQQQKILEGLLRQQKEVSEVQAEPIEVDPFESEEFTKMSEVMNWDEDEANAAKVFFQKFMDYGNKKTLADLQLRTPQMVESTIQHNERIKGVRENFYSAHPMLEEVKPFVGQIARGVAQELGDSATMEAVLKESAKRAYKALGLDPKVVANTAEKMKRQGKKSPAFPVKKGVRKQTVKAPKLQQEIDAIIGA